MDAAPWQSLVANLDDAASRSHAAGALSRFLNGAPETREIAAIVAPLVLDLKTPEGRAAGLPYLIPYVATVAAARELVLVTAKDESADVRLTAIRGLPAMADDARARELLSASLRDPDARVREIAINSFDALLAPAPETQDAEFSLRVLPNQEMTDAALELLDSIESALKTLQDLGGLDDSQIRILDEIVLPAIESLRRLLGSSASDKDGVRELRKEGILRIGTLSGSTKALLAAAPAAIAALAEGDKALENITNSIEALHPFAEALISLVSRAF